MINIKVKTFVDDKSLKVVLRLYKYLSLRLVNSSFGNFSEYLNKT